MKTFKDLMGGVVNLNEAMGGKRHLNFNGVDEIGDFWVVLKASKDSIIDDILFKADVLDMILQKDGGLKMSDVIGFYKKESKAKKVAEKELAKQKA